METEDGEYLCRMTETKREVDGRIVTVYGIAVRNRCGQPDETVVEDVSSDRGWVARLLALIARHQVSPLHLTDVVYDCIINESEADVRTNIGQQLSAVV